MCGIVGFNWDDKRLVSKMADMLSHRGPDDSGVFAPRIHGKFSVTSGHQCVHYGGRDHNRCEPVATSAGNKRQWTEFGRATDFIIPVGFGD